MDNAIDPSGETSLKITSEDCRDIGKVLEFRRLLEPGVCRISVQRADKGVVKALGTCLERMRQSCLAGDTSRFVQADLQFHETICRASENPLAIKSLSRVFREHLCNHEQMTVLFGFDSGLRCHTEILEAFRNGDAMGAEACMARHIQEALDRINGML